MPGRSPTSHCPRFWSDGDARQGLRAAVDPGLFRRLEHLAGDADGDLRGPGVHGRRVADGQAAAVQERGVDVHLTGRAVPAAGDEAVARPGGIAREHLGVDVLRHPRNLDLPVVHRHLVRRARLGAQHRCHRRVLRRGGYLLRSGAGLELLDLHRDRGGEVLRGLGPAQRGMQPDREYHGGRAERDRGQSHEGARGPGERRREPKAGRARQPQPGGEPVRRVPAARLRSAARRDRLRRR